VPVGVFLSGGLDSAIVAAIAARHLEPSGERLKTFAVGTEGSADLMAARVVARHLNTEHHERVYDSREAIRAVPPSIREGALALGATKWEATRVVLQNAKSGITGAIILGLGRAVGETMAVTMVIGNRPEISSSLFDPSFTIASAIANEFTEATSEIYRHALVELGLILFVITFAINAAARLLVWSVTRGQGRAAHA